MRPSPKTIFENNRTKVSCFRKPTHFLKIPFFCELASKRFFITSQGDWALNEQVWASPKPHLETSIICKKTKTNYFLKSFFIGIERSFSISELQLTSDEVWESPCTIFKTSERSWSNFKDKTTVWSYSFANHCGKDGLKFPWYTLNFMWMF